MPIGNALAIQRVRAGGEFVGIRKAVPVRVRRISGDGRIVGAGPEIGTPPRVHGYY